MEAPRNWKINTFEMSLSRAFDRLRQSGLTPPKELTLSITPRCNLKCAHCWPEAGPEHIGSPLGKSTIQRVVRQWVEAGLGEVCLTGGEPLTHPQWLDIVSYCCRLPDLYRVRLQTNATLLTKEIVHQLSGAEYSGLTLQVSLDGAKSTTHDLIRGDGSFDRALCGLVLLSEAGLGPRTIVSFTEMAHNFDELPQLFGLLEELHIGRLVSGTLIKLGRAFGNSLLELPTPNQYCKLITKFHKDSQFNSRYRKMGNIACLEWYVGRSETRQLASCQCMESPFISAEGFLYPCVLLQLKRYAIDQAWDRSFESVVAKATTLWPELLGLSRCRSKLIPQCASCSGQLHCQSGCMGRVSSRETDFMDVEDRCELRKAVYAWQEPSS